MTGPDVWRDKNGIPHVQAIDRRELYRGQGSVHATDRGLQMLLMRILVQGRMSELLAATDESLRIDTFFRKMNWHGPARSGLEQIDGEASEYLQAYCDGANEVFSRRLPWELRVLGYRPDPWQVDDMVTISRMVGYIALQQSQADLERLLVEMIQAGIDRPALEELFPGLLQDADFALLRRVQLGERLVPPEIVWCTAAWRMISSNNWVVSGHKSFSGKPLLCNDPHLEGNRLPNVWCEVVLQVGERYMAGGSMPGAPGILVGRSNDLAWGATYSFADAVDSWIERCKDGQYYREPDEWIAFHQRRETVLRKRKAPIELIFYENDHGVLDGDPNKENLYLATRWAAANSGLRSLELLLRLWDAHDVPQATQLLGQFETCWNFVVADRYGNIGYQMSGLIPRRRKAEHGFVPLPGWQPENDWCGFHPSDQFPRDLNPECGFIVTANNDLNALGQTQPINMPMGPYRAQRIAEVLQNNSSCTLADMQALQFDLTSPQAALFMMHLEPLLPGTRQGDILRDWDLSYSADSPGAFLFEVFYRALIRQVFGGQKLGASVIEYLCANTNTITDFYWAFDRILLSETSRWFGGLSRTELYRNVAQHSLDVEPRGWGDGREYWLSHLLLGGKLPRWCGFDRGPITAIGGRATVHQGQIYRSGNRLTTFVPSLRFTTDLAEDCLWTTLLGGPSDRRFSRWYCSDLRNWLQGNYKYVGPECDGKRYRFP